MRLEPGEHVVVRARRHPRALLGAAAALVATAFLLGLCMGVLARPGVVSTLGAARPWLELLVWAGAALAVLMGSVRPLVRWLTRRTVLTSERLLQRPGPAGGREAAMPLTSIADVQRRRRGSAGDLHVLFQDPLRQVHWLLRDVPEAERFEQVLAETTRRARARHAATAWGGLR